MAEIKVYGININEVEKDISIASISDKDFVKISEQQGLIWSLTGFQNDFNDDEINQSNLFIRFIEN